MLGAGLAHHWENLTPNGLPDRLETASQRAARLGYAWLARELRDPAQSQLGSVLSPSDRWRQVLQALSAVGRPAALPEERLDWFISPESPRPLEAKVQRLSKRGGYSAGRSLGYCSSPPSCASEADRRALRTEEPVEALAVTRLQAEARVAMTGTPVENRVEEIWSLFRFLNPGLLGSLDRFRRRFAQPIELGDPIRRERLARLVRPFLLRRTKSQVLSELPARTELVLEVELSASERAVYEAVRLRALDKLSGEETDAICVLAELMRLRRACCHSRLVMPQAPLDGSKLDLFLISLRAGGVGLNLTGADYVIHMDPWWNPAVEDQASDRAHRMGQTRPVTVYRLVTRHTVEEKIVALHRTKRDLAESLLEGTDRACRLSAEELMGLLGD